MRKNKEERKQFFEALYQKCSQEEVYSVIETAEAMGVSYNLVETWAKNKKLNQILQECRSICAKNARDKQLSKDITWPEHSKYYFYEAQNDDEVAKVYNKEVKRLRLERKKERLEEEERKRKEEIIADQAKEIRKITALNIEYSDRVPQQNCHQVHDQENLPIASESNKNNQLAQWHGQRGTVSEERLKIWREKQAKENSEFCIKKNEDKSDDDTIYLETEFDKPDMTAEERGNLIRATWCAATGVASYETGKIVLTSAASAIHRTNGQDAAQVFTATQDALLAMKPNDIFEGMLCSRLWALHNQSMIHMARASNPDATTESIDSSINRATKLQRLHNETLEALNKHRRKGEQKVTVQHQYVNVLDGGQAIVTSQFTPGGGDKNKNSESEPDAN